MRALIALMQFVQVYSCGWYKDGEKLLPCYWDGARNQHSLANPGSDYAEVKSIFVYNNRVYTAGFYVIEGEDENAYACYWDNTGKRHDLDTGGSKISVAKCILVR